MNKNLEEKRKYFKDSIYLKYENQKNSKEFIENKFEIKKKKYSLISKLQRVAAIIVVFAVGMTVYAGVTGNLNLDGLGLLKINENYESSKIEINKSIENEYCRITLESMAGDSSYIVAQYKIDLKEKAINQFDKIEINEYGSYDFGINNTVYIDSEEIPYNIPYIDKISDTEYIAIQIIEIMKFDKNKFNLEINLESIYVGAYPGYGNNKAEIGKKIQVEVNLKENVKKEIVASQAIDENTEIVVEKVANTKFQTFIKIREIRKNLKWSDFNLMQYTSFLITDENDKEIQCVVYGGDQVNRTIYVHGDNEIKEEYRVKDTDIVDLEDEYLILIGLEQNVDKIKLIPTTNWCYNGYREVKIYNEKTWYPVVSGDKKYSETDSLGGKIEVNKIEVDDENVTFYYEETGLLGKETRVILREKNQRNKFNYTCPNLTEIKGINGDENKSVFSRTVRGAGCNQSHEPYDDISNLEFTLLYGTKTERVGEIFELMVPSMDENTAEIKNVQIIDLEKEVEKEYPNMSEKYMSKEELPEDYTKEQALSDGCFVIEMGEVISEDKNALQKFFDSRTNDSIRIFKVNSIGMGIVVDIEYENGKYYLNSYIPNSKNDETSDRNFVGDKVVKDKKEDRYEYNLESDVMFNQSRWEFICSVKM